MRSPSIKSVTTGMSSVASDSLDYTNDHNNIAYNRKGDSEEKVQVAEIEERNVLRSKLLVITVLALALVIMSTFTFVFINEGDNTTFESEFVSYASEIITVSQNNAKNTLENLESFSDTISSHASSSQQFWPFVTVQDFEARGTQLNSVTKAWGVHFMPLVDFEERKEWESYSSQNYQANIMDAIQYRNYDNASVILNQTEIVPFIYTLEVAETIDMNTFGPDLTPGPYLPIWQSASEADIEWYSGIINWNGLVSEQVRNAYYTSVTTKQTALGFYYWNGTLLAHHITPVFEKVTKAKENKIVGAVWLVVNFLSYFQNILPNEANGIHVVLTGYCAGNITYQQTYLVDGLNAEMVSDGDKHQQKFNKYRITEDFLRFDDVELSDGMCNPKMVMHVYPTEKLMDRYITNEKYYSTALVVAIFLFTSLVFILYDLSVRRRQNKVMDRVMEQHRVVADMFPEQYRDRLFANKNNNNNIGGAGDAGGVVGGGIIGKHSDHKNNMGGDGNHSSSGGGLMSFEQIEATENHQNSAPIADLFPSATVIFADISGFTAWSSTREPTQVFTLLENIYGSFDQIAYRHGVFKIETIGDCYVAVCGLPEQREDHVVPAVLFARDCIQETVRLVQKLELTLGPDTADLSMRIGINSGQVTAGILRGERSRFQLFGDTVNVAARMETTGESNRIHISCASADMLRKFGKSKWISPREDKVLLKGKGRLQTYWLETRVETRKRKVMKKLASKRITSLSLLPSMAEMSPLLLGGNGENDEPSHDNEVKSNNDNKSNRISNSIDKTRREDDDDDDDDDETDHDSWENQELIIAEERLMTKTQRLVEWNVDTLCSLLKQVVASRCNSLVSSSNSSPSSTSLVDVENRIGQGRTVLEEFTNIITLPKISTDELRKRMDNKNPQSIELGEKVISQLRDFISKIAYMYRDNHFHNFEHASHVTSSVRKLLSRIVTHGNESAMTMNQCRTTDDSMGGGLLSSSSPCATVEDLKGHSYGITSDPLTQFAVVLSAVIHDTDHPGVPNTQLVLEKVPIASKYDEKSVAEQNSVTLAWKLLMRPEYKDLRSCIYSNESELKRFRQLVVNTVMATDICDKELGALRKARWAIAFSDDAITVNNNNSNTGSNKQHDQDDQQDDSQTSVNRKATIVIEHLIQASDVSHTMQHWEVYTKWNERFFRECYSAYFNGRAKSDPSENWYKGEIGFFDFYVIPLAKKLESCGVFGVSSHEYLNYALANREEWVAEGEALVQEYLCNYRNLAKHKNDHNNKHDNTMMVITKDVQSNEETLELTDSSISSSSLPPNIVFDCSKMASF